VAHSAILIVLDTT